MTPTRTERTVQETMDHLKYVNNNVVEPNKNLYTTIENIRRNLGEDMNPRNGVTYTILHKPGDTPSKRLSVPEFKQARQVVDSCGLRGKMQFRGHGEGCLIVTSGRGRGKLYCNVKKKQRHEVKFAALHQGVGDVPEPCQDLWDKTLDTEIGPNERQEALADMVWLLIQAMPFRYKTASTVEVLACVGMRTIDPGLVWNGTNGRLDHGILVSRMQDFRCYFLDWFGSA